ncbi:MAG: hypothetical protein ACRDQA_27565 [Nocardioidaceae bacterium]
MEVPSVDLDPQLIERARELTGERSSRAVLDLAAELGAPVASHPPVEFRPS